jgi:hypothetical protein
MVFLTRNRYVIENKSHIENQTSMENDTSFVQCIQSAGFNASTVVWLLLGSYVMTILMAVMWVGGLSIVNSLVAINKHNCECTSRVCWSDWSTQDLLLEPVKRAVASMLVGGSFAAIAHWAFFAGIAEMGWSGGRCWLCHHKPTKYDKLDKLVHSCAVAALCGGTVWLAWSCVAMIV